jgi:hypothetical protein
VNNENPVNPVNYGVQRIALFAAINHLARMSDPRSGHNPDESIKAIRDAIELAEKGNDPAFTAELTAWVKTTLLLVGKVNGMNG